MIAVVTDVVVSAFELDSELPYVSIRKPPAAIAITQKKLYLPVFSTFFHHYISLMLLHYFSFVDELRFWKEIYLVVLVF